MSAALVLIAGAAPEAPLAWALVDGEGRVRERGQSDLAPPPAAAPARTALVLPGWDGRLERLVLPARSAEQARAGAALLFGGALAGGEAMHYAVGEAVDEAGARLAVAIAASRMEQWLERCRALGADPHLVALDCALWPIGEEEAAIAPLADRVIIAGGARGGFTIEPALASTLASRWLGEHELARVGLHGGDAEAWRAALGARMEARPAPDWIAVLAAGAVAAPDSAPNLRQGAFAPQRAGAPPLRLWRFAALLAAAAVLLQIGALSIEGWRDRQAAAQILAGAERDFSAVRPGRIVNFSAQVAAAANAAEQAGRHPVLSVSAPLLAMARQQPLARVDEVRHEAPGRAVRVRLSAPQAGVLEAALAALRAEGLTVEAREQLPMQGRYGAEITLEAP